MATFVNTPFDQPIHQIVSPLFAIRDGAEEYVGGTAFLIGHGWAITAHHVLDDFVHHFRGAHFGPQEIRASFEILGYFTLDGGANRLPVKVLRAWRAEPLDIAVLALGVPENWPRDHVWNVPSLDLFPPKVGTEIVAMGFPNSRFERRESAQTATLTVDPRTTTGRVLELHHTIRDRARLPFPCFRTDARFDGGMSGGPVINNSNGHVCGVICSGMDGTFEQDGHISYASSLWPIIGTQVDATESAVAGATPYPLLQLFRSGVFNARGLDAVDLEQDSNGHFVPRISYNAAEWDHSASA